MKKERRKMRKNGEEWKREAGNEEKWRKWKKGSRKMRNVRGIKDEKKLRKFLFCFHTIGLCVLYKDTKFPSKHW